MKTVLLFGDSNTWGYIPNTDRERFPRDVRWPGVLQSLLGGEWDVIAEGLNGRTATIDRPDSEGRNGLPYLLPCIHSHQPVDVLVIYLGTNDVNFIDDDRVAACVARLVRIARPEVPRIIVVCPPPFDGHRLGPSYRDIEDCELLDLDGVTGYAVVGDDVEHLDADGHAAVARAVAERLLA